MFATDLDSTFPDSASIRTRGFVDFNAPYRLWQTDPAMRFWWNGVTLAGDDPFNPSFDVQIVLIDRSNGTNNGNFDIELNYGSGGDQVPPVGTETNPNANGFQGFKLGPNSSGPTFGPFGPFDTRRRSDSLLLPRRNASDLQLAGLERRPGDSCCASALRCWSASSFAGSLRRGGATPSRACRQSEGRDRIYSGVSARRPLFMIIGEPFS